MHIYFWVCTVWHYADILSGLHGPHNASCGLMIRAGYRRMGPYICAYLSSENLTFLNASPCNVHSREFQSLVAQIHLMRDQPGDPGNSFQLSHTWLAGFVYKAIKI